MVNDLTLQDQKSKIIQTKELHNAVVLANIIEMCSSIVINVAGKDISDTLNSQALSRSVLANLIANELKSRVLPKE